METCEDVFDQRRSTIDGAEVVRIALADGATMTSFARAWALILTECFARRLFYDERTFERMVHIMRRVWTSRLPPDLPWHSQEKVTQGAGATLLGVDLVASGDGVFWSAMAVGDTCMLCYAGTKIEQSFPLTSSAEFDFTPVLVSSAPHADVPVPAFAGGTLGDGGVLVLATDALAKYLLERDGEVDPLDLIGADGRDERFDALRTTGAMKNDDIGVVVVMNDV